MLVQVMEKNRSLDKIARLARQRLHLGIQLLDQSLLMCRDDVHGRTASASPVEKRLPGVTRKRKRAAPKGTAPIL
jgi:hypothetical protein